MTSHSRQKLTASRATQVVQLEMVGVVELFFSHVTQSSSTDDLVNIPQQLLLTNKATPEVVATEIDEQFQPRNSSSSTGSD